MNPARRHAIVFRIGALGDVLLTRRLTYSLSLAGLHSTLVAPARHASVLLADPWIEGVLDSEGPRLARAFAGAWPEEPRGFEIAVVISESSDLAAAASSAAASLIQIPPKPAREDMPIARQWADAVSAVCPPFTGNLPPLPTDTSRAHSTNATLIHPGSGSPRKNWPIERFVELGCALREEGHHIVWIRGPAEADSLVEVSRFQVLDRPTIEALAATLAQARLFVGNDSGVSHLAAAVGARTIALFGPTNPAVWRPDGPRVQTVSSPSGELSAIPVADVLAMIEPWLGTNRPIV